MRRNDSRNAQFAQRIPADVRERLSGKTLDIPLDGETVSVAIGPKTSAIRFSLRTADPSQAKRRQAEVAAHLETVFKGLRESRPVSFTHRQAVAFSKRMYEGWADPKYELGITIEVFSSTMRQAMGFEAKPFVSEPGFLEDTDDERKVEGLALKQLFERFTELRLTENMQALEELVGPIVSRQLSKEGIGELDSAARQMVILEFVRAAEDAFGYRSRNLLESDYSPDLKAGRFPAFEPPGATSAVTVSLTGLVADWWTEVEKTGLKGSTHESYRNTMANFVAFLGHEDAKRVTPEDVIRFKDFRLASINPRNGKPISPKTVKDSDLSGLKAVFNWALTNRRIATNPALGVTIKLAKKRRLRSPGFTDAEAKAILTAASSIDLAGKPSKSNIAKHWVPWVLAYTGARVGEIAQLRKDDLRQEGELWILRITPEAGTVKTNEAREVVLHADLIERGFVSFVLSSPSGHLFVKPSKAKGVAGPLKGLTNRLAAFAREIVPDRGVLPNHGWRHRFKTVGLEVGIEQRVLDAIQGHAPDSVGATYGEVTVKAQGAAIAKMSAYTIGSNVRHV